MKRYIQPAEINKGGPGAPVVGLNWRDRLKSLLSRDGAQLSEQTLPRAAPAPAKSVQKSSLPMGAILGALERGSSGVDRDGQVLNPSSEQRGMEARLSAMFPRGPGA